MKNSNSKRTNQMIPTLITEIIFEILLKLPVDSLLRCKSVCKEWYSLISDPYFIKSHLAISNSNNHYPRHRLIYNNFEERKNLKVCTLSNLMFDESASSALLLENLLQRTQSRAELSIDGSCNGLVCLFVDYPFDGYELFIYNPSTRIWNGLPFRGRNSEHFAYHGWYSFGYDESTDDYKIVEMCTTVEIVSFDTLIKTIEKVNIYSLKTGKWKNLGDFSYECPLSGCGIFSNGALHWVVNGDSPETTQRIVSLDLTKETYGEVLKFEYDEDDAELSLGILGQWLCGLCCHSNRHADLWVMKVYGVKDSWTKLASFPYLTDELTDYKLPVPLFISNDGKVLLACAPDLVIFKSKDSSYEEDIDKFRQACVVVESLVSPFPPLALANNNEN